MIASHALDKEEWSSIEVDGEAPSPRTLHCPASFDDSLVVFGGGECGVQPARQVGPYVFTVSKGAWEAPPTTGQAPPPTQGHTCACVGRKMYVYGGMTGSDFHSSLHILHLGEGLRIDYIRTLCHIVWSYDIVLRNYVST